MKISFIALSAALLAGVGIAPAASIVSYTHNTDIDNQSDDGTLLNDDETGTTAWSGGHYVGFGDAGTSAWASTTFTFDAVYDFATIDLYSYETYNAGYVEVSTSTDNVTFSAPTQYILTNTAVGGSSTAVTDSLDVTALADAQYVKIEWFKTTEHPGTGNWVFLSEVDFTAVPEPSAALLGGLGVLLLLLRRRRCA